MVRLTVYSLERWSESSGLRQRHVLFLVRALQFERQINLIGSIWSFLNLVYIDVNCLVTDGTVPEFTKLIS